MHVGDFLPPDFDKIPEELRSFPFLVWRGEGPAGTKPRKVPYSPAQPQRRASVTDSSTWGSFEQARAAYEAGAFSGIGIVLTGDGLVGVDIDHCIDGGATDPSAKELLDQLGAGYVEQSPSGTGLRAFGYAQALNQGVKGKLNGLDVELYSTSRYLTITGRCVKPGGIPKLPNFCSLAEYIRTSGIVSTTTSAEAPPLTPVERQAELVTRILSGDVFHDSLRDFAASLAANGMRDGAAVNLLYALMDASSAPHDARWLARRGEIPGLVTSAQAKFGPSQTTLHGAAPTPVVVTIADLLTREEPPHPFLWGKHIPSGALTLLGAHGGVGKSGFGLQLAAHVSAGVDFLNAPVSKATTLFFSAEDAGSVVRRRLGHLCRHHGIDPIELAKNLHIVDATEAGVLFAEDVRERKITPTATFGALEAFIEANGIKFVVVDNSSDTFAGNPFDRAQVTQFVRALVRVVAPRDGAVLLLSHVAKATARAGARPTNAEGYADSAAWNNAARSRLFMYEDGEQIVLEHQKSNYGPKADPLRLTRLQGCGVSVAVTLGDKNSSFPQRSDETLVPRLLEMLREFYVRGDWISSSANSPGTNAHAMLKKEPGFPALGKAETMALLRDMQRQGLIRAETYQRSNRHSGERWAVTELGLARMRPPSATQQQPRQVAPTSPFSGVDAVDANRG